MTTLFSHEAFHDDVGHAFNEMIMMDQLSRMPEESLLRIMQSFPPELLRKAADSRGEHRLDGAFPTVI